MSFTVARIDHVEVYVRDIEQSVEWYAKVLGLRETYRFEGSQPVMIGAGDTMLALFKADPDADPPQPSSDRTKRRWLLVAWNTTAEGFEEAQQHLKECGVDFRGPIDHKISKSIYFQDLEGHPLEITYYL